MKALRPPRLSLRVAIMAGVGLACGITLTGTSPGGIPDHDWAAYGGSSDSSQYSPLGQIDRSNVSRMEVAWTFALPDNSQSKANPLVVGGTLYQATTAGIVALDAATGKLLWSMPATDMRMRGLTYWQDPTGRDRRLIFAHDDKLRAINAADGRPAASFGNGGAIDLKTGLGRDPDTVLRIASMTPSRIFENLIIVGSAPGEAWDGAPGDIRAYDVRTGKPVWTFHTVPRPGEFGYDTWPKDNWKTAGGVNCWGEMTIDEKNGIVFVPLGSASYDFYGVDRPGNNLFSDSPMALDARTGKRLWHYQLVHHDLWDYDLNQGPKLLTLTRAGKQVEAVVQATKSGYIYAFERLTGKPIFPIREQRVPRSDVPGERSSPTQPIPTLPEPFVRHGLKMNDISPLISADERAELVKVLGGLRNEGPFTPPSLRGSVVLPGTQGGGQFGNGAVDARTGRFYIASVEAPAVLKLEPASGRAPSPLFGGVGSKGLTLYSEHCQACHGASRAGQPPAIPSLLGIADRKSIAQTAAVIRSGRGVMPPFALQNGEVAEIMTYLGYSMAGQSLEAQLSAGHEQEKPSARPMKPGPPSPIKYNSGYNFLFSRAGYPVIRPPWSTLTAYDMNTGRKLWQVPFGEVEDLAAQGHRDTGSILPKGTIVVSASGLIFSSNQDRKLRVWDARDGKVLATFPLPSAPAGIPAIYAVGGRQFVAVPVASFEPVATIPGLPDSMIGKRGTNSIVAFALPR